MAIFLETKRLIIKTPDIKDIDKIYTLDSDPDVMRYIGNGLPRSKEESRQWYNKSVQYYGKYGYSFGLVYEKETGEFVGRAGINHNAYDDSQPDIEVGYRLFKKFWNKGYATELAMALIEWGFKNLELEKICGFASPNNKASRHVLEKAGMKLIGLDKYAEEEVVRYEIFKNKGEKL